MIKHLRFLAALLLCCIASAGWAEEASFEPSNFSGQGTSGSGSAISATVAGITFACDKGYGTTQIRCYSGGKITISSTNTITAISFTFSGTYTGGLETSYTGLSTTSWEKTLSSQARITAVTVTYTTGTVTPTCATPTFTPAEGAVAAGTEVTISSTTDGATIYYTTDGTEPSATNGTQGTIVIINNACTVKAIAVKDGAEDSEVATAEYTIKQTVSGLNIDFENDVDCYDDWAFENIGNSNTAITAHGGDKYGANINDGGNGVATASITTKNKVANPTTFTCYVSKISTNTTSSTWYVEVSSDGSNWTNVKTQSATSMNKGEWTEVTANLGTYKNVYVRLRYDGSTAIRAVDDISIVEGGKMTATVTIDKTSLNIGETATVTTDGPAVTLTTSNASIASVSGTTVTAVTAGTATITAAWAENDEYEGGSQEFTITVTDPNASGSINNPYTVAQARAAIDAGTGLTGVYATGIVSEIVTAYSSQYGNISYNISADGLTTSDQLQAYRGKSYNGENFTSEDDIQVGDVVVVYGTLKKFNETYEFDANNQLVSLTRPEKPKHQVSFYVNGEVSSTLEVSEEADITFPEDPANIYDKTFVGWTANEIEGTQDEAPEMVTTATMGTADVTFYAVFATASEGDIVETTDVLNKATTGVSGTTYTAWSGKTVNSSAVYAGQSAGGNDCIQLRSSNSNSGVITTKSGGKLKSMFVTWSSYTDEARVLSVYGSNTAYSAATDLYNSDKQGTLIGELKCEDKGTDLNSAVLTITDDYAYIGIRSKSGALYLSSVSITWEGAGATTYSGYCTTVEAPEPVSVNISAAGYSTLYYGTKNLTVPEGMEAYTVKVTTKVERSTTYNAGDVIPAGTGVVLKAAQGTYEFTVAATAGEKDADNMLRGNDVKTLTTGGTYYYALTLNAAKDPESAGFYWMKENGAAYEAGAHKAYLALDNTFAELAEGSAKGFLALPGDDVDGIGQIENGELTIENSVVYDLSGRKLSTINYQLSTLPKGIYIVNGKKVVVK